MGPTPSGGDIFPRGKPEVHQIGVDCLIGFTFGRPVLIKRLFGRKSLLGHGEGIPNDGQKGESWVVAIRISIFDQPTRISGMVGWVL
jgi:hypothetical protein